LRKRFDSSSQSPSRRQGSRSVLIRDSIRHLARGRPNLSGTDALRASRGFQIFRSLPRVIERKATISSSSPSVEPARSFAAGVPLPQQSRSRCQVLPPLFLPRPRHGSGARVKSKSLARKLAARVCAIDTTSATESSDDASKRAKRENIRVVTPQYPAAVAAEEPGSQTLSRRAFRGARQPVRRAITSSDCAGAYDGLAGGRGLPRRASLESRVCGSEYAKRRSHKFTRACVRCGVIKIKAAPRTRALIVARGYSRRARARPRIRDNERARNTFRRTGNANGRRPLARTDAQKSEG